jgi:hypothetical protein
LKQGWNFNLETLAGWLASKRRAVQHSQFWEALTGSQRGVPTAVGSLQ